MRAHIPRMALLHGALIGAFALTMSALGSEGLNDLSARLVLIAVFSLWSAVGSGISAFVLLNVDAEKT